MGGTFERIREVADSSIKTLTHAPLGAVRLLPRFSSRKLGGICFALSASCRVHTEWAHFWCILLGTHELLACPHSREVSWTPPLDGRLMVALQRLMRDGSHAHGHLQGLIYSAREPHHVERERMSEGASRMSLWVNTDSWVENLGLLQLFPSLGPCLFSLWYFRGAGCLGNWFFECLPCFLYSWSRGWKHTCHLKGVVCAGSQTQPQCQQSRPDH